MGESPYLIDASGFQGHAERIFAPATESEVIAVLREASQTSTPVTIAGAGTGLTGGRVAPSGWVLSLEKLNGIQIAGGEAQAGPGASLGDLHAAAARTGQFYAPDPTETLASVGGTIATNASGSRSFRYGDTRRHVLRLRVALMTGQLLDIGRGDRIDFDAAAIALPRTTKSTAGYRLRPGMDWIDLFVGSEGTLGVITGATLRLLPAPEALLAGVVFFAADDQALDAVDLWRSVSGIRMLEYFDGPSLALLARRFPDVPGAVGAAILFEQELASEEDAEMDLWPGRLQSAGAFLDASWFALGAADRERFRRFRHALPESVNDIVRRNGCLKMGSDFAVPVDRNREMLSFYKRRLAAEFPDRFVIFGHIGDAHVHVNILPSNAAESERAHALMEEFAKQAVRLGGTVSAEHGLGKRKAHFLALQYTSEEIAAMAAVKRRLDPQWLLGRGTLLPAPE